MTIETKEFTTYANPSSGDDPNFSDMRVGDSSGEVEISNDGVRLTGDSTCWMDMVMGLFGRRLNSTTGKVDYAYGENAIKFQPSGSISTAADRVCGNQQINHNFKVGTGIVFYPHIHYFQQITGSAIAIVQTFTMQYRLQRNGHAKATSWTQITATAGTDDVFDFTSESDGLYNQLISFPAITIECGISDTFQIQVARTDSNTGDVYAYFLDTHGAVDSYGSEEVLSKT